MKMLKEHYDGLKGKIQTFLAENPESVERYESGHFPRSELTKDLNKRFRWDLFSMMVRADASLTQTMYAYLTDDHIDTALKSIVPVINRKFTKMGETNLENATRRMPEEDTKVVSPDFGSP